MADIFVYDYQYSCAIIYRRGYQFSKHSMLDFNEKRVSVNILQKYINFQCNFNFHGLLLQVGWRKSCKNMFITSTKNVYLHSKIYKHSDKSAKKK